MPLLYFYNVKNVLFLLHTLYTGKLRHPTSSSCALIDVITSVTFWVGNFPLWSGNNYVYTVLREVILSS